MTVSEPVRDPLLETVQNLSHYHREHEKYYSEAPLQDALALQRTSRTLKALAERWTTAVPADSPAPSPFPGAPDLNDARAIEASGVLFMESGEPPQEVERIVRDLAGSAADYEQSGAWLASAMEGAWGAAEALLGYPELADFLGERHHIIANDWLNASSAGLISRHLTRAVAVLDRVDFSAAALRADLAGPRHAPGYLYSAAELVDRAADFAAQSAILVHENERRWRVFAQRVETLTTPGA
jgi:hypothetical protein